MAVLNRLLVVATAGCFVVMLLAGCSPGEKELTKTEKLRLTLDPKTVGFLLEGEQAYKRGFYRLALALSDSAEQFAPELADIHFLRGRIYTDLNQLDIAHAAYQRVIELDPDYPGVRLNMGVNEVRQGQLRTGLAFFKKEEAVAASSNLYLEMARVYAKLGVADSARFAYEKALSLDSTNATAHMWFGQLYEETGDLELALVHSRKGAQLKPDNLDYRYVVGSQLYRLGRIEEAAEQLFTVAEQRPWHHGAQYNLGQALLRLGREDEANRYLVRADSAQQMQQKISEAESAINLNPDDLTNWIKLGELLRSAGLYERAIEAFKVAATMEPQNLYLQANLATVVMEGGDTEDATRRYLAILSVDSSLTDVWLNLGVAYARAGNYEDARRTWEFVQRKAPSDSKAEMYLAELTAQEAQQEPSSNPSTFPPRP